MKRRIVGLIFVCLFVLALASSIAAGEGSKTIVLGLGDRVVVTCTIGTPHITTTQYGRGILVCSD